MTTGDATTSWQTRGKWEERRQRTRGTGPRWALRSGGKFKRTRGGGIDVTTSLQTRDFCDGGKSNGDGDGDGDGDGKCHTLPSRVFGGECTDHVAEAVAALIADDADGGNSGVAIVGRASLVARDRLIINSIVYLLSTLLYFLPLLGTNIVTHHGVSQSLLVISVSVCIQASKSIPVCVQG